MKINTIRYIPEGFEKTFDNGFLVVYKNVSNDGKILAFAYHGRSNKRDWYYHFSSQERLEACIAESVSGWNKRNETKIQRKEERKAFINPFSVGNILCRTWGYDQTNVDFYQVIKITTASIIVRKIAQTITDDGFLTGTCLPLKDNFLDNEEQRVRVNHSYTSVGGAWDGRPVRWSAYA